jgi:uncharacterized protein (DUF58 family)
VASVRPTRLIATLLCFTLALVLVARTTGAGWTVVVVCCVTAAMVVGTAWPALVVRRLSIDVVAPPDATVGRELTFELGVAGVRSPLRARLVEPAGPWVAVNPPVTGPIAVVPDRRGVVETVTVEVQSAAPLGLVWWRRERTVTLARPTEVAPRLVEQPLATTAMATRPGGETVRSVREYVPGDPARLVHWPSTAHRGQLIVKELEEPDHPGVVLLVDRRGDADRAEEVASRAMGAAVTGVRAGLTVTLLTAEVTGPKAGIVRTPLEAGRRLARAVAGAPAEGPLPDGATFLRLGTQ